MTDLAILANKFLISIICNTSHIFNLLNLPFACLWSLDKKTMTSQFEKGTQSAKRNQMFEKKGNSLTTENSECHHWILRGLQCIRYCRTRRIARSSWKDSILLSSAQIEFYEKVVSTAIARNIARASLKLESATGMLVPGYEVP